MATRYEALAKSPIFEGRPTDAPPGLQSILLDFWQRPIQGSTIRGNSFFGDSRVHHAFAAGDPRRDSEGDLLRADKTYRLLVPKDVPVGQFWSLTLCSEDTRRPYDNGNDDIRGVSLDSNMRDLKYNEDGSVDLFVGEKPQLATRRPF